MQVVTWRWHPARCSRRSLKLCLHPVLYNHIKSNIVAGFTPVLGPGDTVMELMRDGFLLEHSLFSIRLDFF
jgi:hypothetical protein